MYMFLYINSWRYERKRKVRKKPTGSDSNEVPIEIH